jgi:hypothetical protein
LNIEIVGKVLKSRGQKPNHQYFCAMRKILFAFAILAVSCNYDSIVPEQPECGETVTYEMDTREIISLTCATADCHVAGGTGIGDYTSYDNMSAWLNEDFFEKVIRENEMPPVGSPELTPADRETLLCWIEDNYPEN